jgi:Tfp pilus assembly protein PilF
VNSRFHSSLRFVSILSAIIVTLTPATALAAPQSDHRLGAVHFPNSCSPAAQDAINTGVALLHSFEYQQAQQAFTELLQREPKCPAAHWGKAMAGYMQIWEFPNDKLLKTGRDEIAKGKKLAAPDAPEQGFLNTAAVFFQKGKKSHIDRTKPYSDALQALHEKQPHDPDVGSFYALSLIALAYEADDNQQTKADLEKAIAVLRPLLQEFPDHPGVTHYMIHATDRPEYAPQGLEAARRYAAIAPDSSHALHMPSHIFVRLGLWQDSIASNLAAQKTGAEAAARHQAEAHYQIHAMDFLGYSYLQSGQAAKAREVIEQTASIVGADDNTKARVRSSFAARTALELHDWKAAAALNSGDPAASQRAPLHGGTYYWAKAIGAARSGDLPAAQAALKQFTQKVQDRDKDAHKHGYAASSQKPVDLAEVEAWVAFAGGKTDEALKELREAADRDDKGGGEGVGIPAREMLADMLMEAKRPAEALVEYKASLQNAPRRFDGLLGAARAAQATGDATAAQSFYAQLAGVCAPNADRAELAEAKSYVAAK